MMTLGNMRENGVRSLAITCGAIWCHHQAVLDASTFADDVTVPSFGLRVVCTVCGAIGADARPNWNERAPRRRCAFVIVILLLSPHASGLFTFGLGTESAIENHIFSPASPTYVTQLFPRLRIF